MIKKGFNIDEARGYLTENNHRWERPSDYAGFSPDGDYLIAAVTRDSYLLDRVNYKVAKKLLDDLEEKLPGREDDRVLSGFLSQDIIGTWSYDWRASHWAVGWCDYLMVSEDSPDEMIILAAEILYSKDSYPVLDEDVYSDAEFKEGHTAWNEVGLEQRVEWCQEAGVSIFSARNKDLLPPEVFDWIRNTGWVHG